MAEETPKGRVFISWSGQKSGAAASVLRDWLPDVINAIRPWLSAEDIAKGARWASEISTKLGETTAGVICLTPSNISSPWILFEAGALSKTIADTFVCPLLIDLDPAAIKGPLSQFQMTKTTKDDMLKLVQTLNKSLGEKNALSDDRVQKAFGKWWPDLDAAFKKLPPDEVTARVHRSEREILEEVLELVRSLTREQSKRNDASRRLADIEAMERIRLTDIDAIERIKARLADLKELQSIREIEAKREEERESSDSKEEKE